MIYKEGAATPAPKKKKRARIAPTLATALLAPAVFCVYALAAVKTRGAAFWPVFWAANASFAAAALVLLRAALTRKRHLKARTASTLVAFTVVFSAIQLLAGAIFVTLPELKIWPPLAVQGALLLIYAAVCSAVFSRARREAPPAEASDEPADIMKAVEREVSEIAARCENRRAKEMIMSVSDALLFSDSLSDFDTASCEDAIARYVYQLETLDDLGDLATVESICDAIHIQIERRNEICAAARGKGN